METEFKKISEKHQPSFKRIPRKKKQNHHTFNFQEGFLKFNINIWINQSKNGAIIECYCDISRKHGYCGHIEEFLKSNYLLDQLIYLYPFWSSDFIEKLIHFLNLKNLNHENYINWISLVKDELDRILENFECPVCLDPLKPLDLKTQCPKCYKPAHTKCLTKWINRHKNSEKKNVKCLYCHD